MQEKEIRLVLKGSKAAITSAEESLKEFLESQCILFEIKKKQRVVLTEMIHMEDTARARDQERIEW